MTIKQQLKEKQKDFDYSISFNSNDKKSASMTLQSDRQFLPIGRLKQAKNYQIPKGINYDTQNDDNVINVFDKSIEAHYDAVNSLRNIYLNNRDSFPDYKNVDDFIQNIKHIDHDNNHDDYYHDNDDININEIIEEETNYEQNSNHKENN